MCVQTPLFGGWEGGTGNKVTRALPEENPEVPHGAGVASREVTILPSSFSEKGEGSAPSSKSASLSLSANQASGPRPLVLLEDICRKSDFHFAAMVKKQPLAKGGVGSHDDRLPSKSQHSEARDSPGSSRRKRDGAETGDRTVSSTSKNIFENLMAGRRSPRRSSMSPRCNTPSSTQEEAPEAWSSSEEKQQMSIATAVKALRGLSGKVSETPSSGKSSPRPSRKDKETAAKDKNSRNASPSSSTSPKCANSTSPKRQSPRRMAEKMSPPLPAVAPMQKSPKMKKSPSSCPESDTSQSPSSRRSPRRCGEPVSSGVSYSDSPVSSPPALDKSPRERERRGGGRCAGQKYAVKASMEQHTIQILSSTSQSSKVVQMEQGRSPVCTVRKLFVNTQSDSDNNPPSGKSATPVRLQKCGVSSSSVQETASDKRADKPSAVFVSSSSSSVASGSFADVNSGMKKSGVSLPDESLLCAILAGGSDVTRSYEKSRDQKMPQPANVAMSECSDSMDWKPSEGSCLNDSFFDDDTTGDVPEDKPYELPVLSQLPPLKKPSQKVLDLTDTEPSPPSPPPACQAVSCGHSQRTASLLQLISKVTQRLPDSSEACQSVVRNVRKLLTPSEGEGSGPLHGGSQTVVLEEDQPQSPGTDRDEAHSHTVSCTVHDQTVSCEGRNVTSSSPQGSCSVGPSVSGELTQSLLETTAEGIQTGGEATGRARIAPSVVSEAPDSPNSLGELDTIEMTQAATRAVQNHIVKDFDAQSGKTPPPDVPSHNAGPASKTPLPGTSGLSPCGGQGTASEPDDSSKPGPSSRAFSSQSQSRSFFSRIASPAKQRWKPKVEPTSSPGRPAWSKWHKVIHPQPISVLGRHEKSATTGLSAFISKNLDSYLNQSCNRYVVPACKESCLAKILLEEGHVKDYGQLQKHISGEEDLDKLGQEAGDKSEEEDDGEEDDRDSEAARKLDPDFDEVEGLVFVSFSSEIGVKAHMTLENTRQWEGGSTAYLNMAKFHAFEESRRKEGKVRRESQGLRGQHMKWRRYQRLYRKELRHLYDGNNKDAPWPQSKLPEKTSDIHKIKNWKNKFPDIKTEEMEALELLGEEERIKRKRKTYVFSSKKKKMKRSLGSPEISPLKREPVEDDGDDEDVDQEEEEEEEEDDGYGVPIPIDEDQYMEDVKRAIEELHLKEKGLKQNKGFFLRFNLGPEERHIIKKLGGWNTRYRRFRRMPQEMKEGDVPHRTPRKKAPKKSRQEQRFELKTVSSSVTYRAVTALCIDATVDGCRQPATRDPGSHGSAVKVEGGGDYVDLTVGESTTSDLGRKKLDCDKPGCRYGCICHLCVPSTESDETDQTQTPVLSCRACDKQYCRLGCICDCLSQPGVSLQDSMSLSLSLSPVCAKPDCAERCVCVPLPKGERPTEPQPLTSIKQDMPPSHHPGKGDGGDQAESSSDELPTLEKTAPRRQRSSDRYSNLPRRQTSNRVAKSMDAVTLKAMKMWTSSEMYSKQTPCRRKKGHRWVDHPAAAVMEARVPGQWVDRPAALVMEAREQGRCWIDHPAAAVMEARVQGRHWVDRPSMAESIVPAVSTSSPSVLLSPAITSSPCQSASSPSLSTVSSTPHSNMVTTAVSVNTLPAVMTCLSVPSSLPLVSQSPTNSTVKISPQVTTAASSPHSSVPTTSLGSSTVVQVSSSVVQPSLPVVQMSPPVVQGSSTALQGSSPGSSQGVQASSAVVQSSSSVVQSSSSVHESSSVQRSSSVQGSSPAVQASSPAVVVSDDEGKADTKTKEGGAESSLQSKRLHRKRKLACAEEDSEASAAKTLVRDTSPVSAISLSSSSESGDIPTRPPPQPWNSSLICLNANNPIPVSDSDDVLEEDEIKVVELSYNCQWDHRKEDILQAITSNVKRGYYPEPRVQIIGNLRVEILPKASKPCTIPGKLRPKLPKFMYPVRVRVTEALKPPRVKDSSLKSRDIIQGSEDRKAMLTDASQWVGGLNRERVKQEQTTGEMLNRAPAATLTRLTTPTTTPSSGRLPMQAVVPRPSGGAPSIHHSLTPGLAPTATGGGGGLAGGSAEAVGISGLGCLQISQNQPASRLMISPEQPWQQTLRIQKKGGGGAEEGATTSAGEKRKKKKKKKKNSLGDDSLVPDLSNLSVSPRKSPSSSLNIPYPPTPLLTSPPFTTSTPTTNLYRSPHPQARGPLKEPPGLSPVQPIPTVQGVPPIRSPPMAGGMSGVRSMPMVFPPGHVLHPVAARALQPQMLGFQAKLSNIQLLRFPNQVQLVSTRALSFKPMDKNVPNFVAVPVSFTSVAQQGLAGKKPGKFPAEGNSKGPPGQDGNSKGPPGQDGNSKGPPSQDGNSKCSSSQDGNFKWPPAPDGNTKGTPAQYGNSKWPPAQDGNSKWPPAQDGSYLSSPAGGNMCSDKEPAPAGDDKSRAVSDVCVDPSQETTTVVKKKKKRRKRLVEEGKNPNRESEGVGGIPASPLLVAGSPSPVMTCTESYPVYSMTNAHSLVPPHPSTPSLPLSTTSMPPSTLFLPHPLPSASVSTKSDAPPFQQTMCAVQHGASSPQSVSADSSSVSCLSRTTLDSVSATTPILKKSAQENRMLHSSNQTIRGPGGQGSLPSTLDRQGGVDVDRVASPHAMSDHSPHPPSCMDVVREDLCTTVSDEDSKGSWPLIDDLSTSEVTSYW
ncbi:hypothetical protein ACOMHN_034991 [Nucella lapillus]